MVEEQNKLCGLFLPGIGHSEICSETQNKTLYGQPMLYLDIITG